MHELHKSASENGKKIRASLNNLQEIITPPIVRKQPRSP